MQKLLRRAGTERRLHRTAQAGASEVQLDRRQLEFTIGVKAAAGLSDEEHCGGPRESPGKPAAKHPRMEQWEPACWFLY